MKTPLGTEVDLGAGHIVLDGFSAQRKGHSTPPPLLGPCLLWPRSPISATAELLFYIPVNKNYQNVTNIHKNKQAKNGICIPQIVFECLFNTQIFEYSFAALVGTRWQAAC